MLSTGKSDVHIPAKRILLRWDKRQDDDVDDEVLCALYIIWVFAVYLLFFEQRK